MVSPRTPRRATNLEELIALPPPLTKEGYQAGLAFQPRPSDVLISPFHKNGTTWLQQIAHGLRTRGSMDFEEITDVTPWIERAHDVGWNLEGSQVAEPRIYKSHLSYYDIPKGGRYICSFRNPYDVTVSSYRFFEGWLFESGTISLEDFTHERITKNPEGYWYHLVSWWEQRENENVLLLCFEDMKIDLPSTVQSVARFMGIALDNELLDVIVRQSSKEYMLAHKTHFDDHLIQEQEARLGGAPPDPETAKVTPGVPNHDRYKLSPELKGELDAIWHKMIYQRFGFADYSALRVALSTLSRS